MVSPAVGIEVGQALKAAGFEVAKTTNTKERITKTIIRSGENNTDAAKLVASYLKDPTLETRFPGRWHRRRDGRLRFRGLTESGLTEVPVESGTICLAPSPSPSALPAENPAPHHSVSRCERCAQPGFSYQSCRRTVKPSRSGF